MSGLSRDASEEVLVGPFQGNYLDLIPVIRNEERNNDLFDRIHVETRTLFTVTALI